MKENGKVTYCTIFLSVATRLTCGQPFFSMVAPSVKKRMPDRILQHVWQHEWNPLFHIFKLLDHDWKLLCSCEAWILKDEVYTRFEVPLYLFIHLLFFCRVLLSALVSWTDSGWTLSYSDIKNFFTMWHYFPGVNIQEWKLFFFFLASIIFHRFLVPCNLAFFLSWMPRRRQRRKTKEARLLSWHY